MNSMVSSKRRKVMIPNNYRLVRRRYVPIGPGKYVIELYVEEKPDAMEDCVPEGDEECVATAQRAVA